MPLAAVDAVVSLAKRRGFVHPSAEIYGGARSGWDYGPLGVALKENVRRQWWRSLVQLRDDVVGLDSAVLLPPQVWAASGHVEAEREERTRCQRCGRTFGIDALGVGGGEGGALEAVACPACGCKGTLAEPHPVSMLVETCTEGSPAETGASALRPETTQGAVLGFAHVVQASRRRPPFGVAQVGRVFRAEAESAPFLLGLREPEQMAVAYFVRPGEEDTWREHWVAQRLDWYRDLGLDAASLRLTPRAADRLPHTARQVTDLEYRYGFPQAEWATLESVADRGDGDLRRHAAATGQPLDFLDQVTGERYVPVLVEPAAVLDRALLAFLVAAYAQDEAPNTKGGLDERVVLRLDPRLAPVKVAVLPLSRHADLSPLARSVAADLRRAWPVDVDDAGAIGRRYRRQDEVGTPFCVTVDFETLADQAVTVRARDTMAQERVGLDALEGYLAARLAGC